METTTVELDRLLRHSDWLRALAGRLVRDAAAADDLVQDTFLAALKSPPDPARPARPWLAGVLRNLVRMRARTDGRRRARDERAARRDELPATSELIERVDTRRRLAAEVVRLAEPYRTTLLLHYFEALPAAEIARRQGVPAGTVRWRLKRGLDELRGRLDESFADRRAWCLALGALADAPGAGSAPAVGLAAAAGVRRALGALALAALVAVVAWLALRPVPDAAAAALGRAPLAAGPPPADPGAGAAAEARGAARAAAGGAAAPGAAAPARLSLALREHDGRPAAGWRALLARGGGRAEPLTFDAAGRLALPALDAPAELYVDRPGAFVERVPLAPGSGPRTIALERRAVVSGRVLVDGRPPRAPLALKLTTDRPLHAPRLAALGLGLDAFWTHLERGRKALVETDAEGRFEVLGLERDWSGLLILPLGFARADDRRQDYDGPDVAVYEGDLVGPTVRLDAPQRGLVVELTALPRLRARVVDPLCAAPVPGARYAPRFRARGAPVGAPAEGRADGEGRFELWLPAADGLSLELSWFDAAGRRGGRVALDGAALAADLDLGDLELAPGRQIALRVLDAAGAPLAGARAVAEGMQEGSAPSGADGRIALGDVSEHAQALLVGAPGHRTARVPLGAAGPEALEVALEPAGALSVRAGPAAAHLVVELRAGGGAFVGGAPGPDPLSRARLGRTFRGAAVEDGRAVARFALDADGALELEDVRGAPGQELALRDALGRVAARAALDAPAPGERRAVELCPDVPLRALEGRVSIAGEGPLVGAIVTVSDGAGHRASLRAGRQGEFRVTGIAAARVDVEVKKPGFVRVSVVGYALDGGPPLALELAPGATLRIAVRDAAGRPVAGATASARAPGDDRVWTARELEPGRLELADVPRGGPLTVEVAARGETVTCTHDPLGGELVVELR